MAKIELPNITQLETNLILDKHSLKNTDLNSMDILVVYNLFNALNAVYKSLDKEISIELIFELHSLIAYNQALEVGEVRTAEVFISGVSYLPPNPKFYDLELDFNNAIEKLNSESKLNNIEASINFLLDSCRKQYFWDGNKRTAFMIANLNLLKNGNGIIGLDTENILEFNKLLSEFYETNQKENIALYLYEQCINTFGFKNNSEFNINYFKELDKNK